MYSVSCSLKLKFTPLMIGVAAALLTAACQIPLHAAEPTPREVLEQYIKAKTQAHANAGCCNGGYCAVLEPGASQEELDVYMRSSVQVGSRYNTVGGRFSSTALTPSTVRGDPVVITYSFVRDGITVAQSPYQAAGPNNLNTTLNSQFGGSGWKTVFRNFFTRWEQVSGVRFQEVSDDGAAWGASGQAGVRGDMRIWGIAIPGGVAAYTYYPGSGAGCDMVVDTSLSWADSTSNYIFMRDALGHETGHGLGLGHCTSSTSHFLMEPYVDTTIDGPQDDDVRGVQRQYGDTYERPGSSGTGHNNTLSTATDLGTISGSRSFPYASIDDGADVDYYKFSIGASSNVTVTITPMGGSYSIGNQGGTEATKDTTRIQDLKFDLLNSSGGVLKSVNASGLGGSETVTVSLSAGIYFVKVDDVTNAADVQLYTLSVNVCSGSTTTPTPVLTSISVSPSSASIQTGQTQQFSATARDQNGATMSPQPAFIWTVNGGGSISSSGLFTAGSTAGGPYTVTATASGVSGNASVTVTASTTTTSTSLPSPWQDRDIGGTGAAGSATGTGTSFTGKGAGADIWGSSDAFNYVYQTLSGDCQIVARVDSVQNTNSWAKAGVMIRETLNADSKHAFVAVTAGNGVVYQRRLSTAGSSTSTTGAYVAAPRWVKLVRSGSTFSAYQSADGATWTQFASESISMASTVNVGLAVTSHSYGVINSSGFSNVAVTVPGTSSTTGGTITPALIQAEDYRTGGEGVGYHDTTGGNSGGAYRSDNVDIEKCSDASGGYDICYIASGEWLAYNISASASGNFNIALRTACWAYNRTVHLEIDGVRVTSSLVVPYTGGSQTYTNLTATNISISAGSHVLKVVFEGDNMNFNYISISSASAVELGADNPPALNSCAATPNEAGAGQSIAFVAAATDADNDALSYAWDFGDGTFGSGANAAHAYAAEGFYVVNVTVDDGRGGTDSATIDITVGSTEIRTDMTVNHLKAGLNLEESGNDTLRMNATFELPAGFNPADMPLVIDCGGAETHLVLNAKGVAQYENGVAKLNRRRGSNKAQLNVNIRKASLVDALWNELPGDDANKADLPVEVKITIGDISFTATYQGKYSAKAGKVARIY